MYLPCVFAARAQVLRKKGAPASGEWPLTTASKPTESYYK